MARPKKKDAMKQYTIMLQEKDMKEIDRMAQKAGITRAKLMRNLLIYGLDEMKGADRLGLVTLAALDLKMMKKLKKKFSMDELAVLSDEEEDDY